jgi:hypothetical protein
MPAGVVTLLGALLWSSSPCYGFRWKPLTFAVSTAAAQSVSLPFWGRRCGAPFILGLVSLFLVASFGFSCFLLLIFDLLCKSFFSPPCIGSIVVALFIKRDESLFRGEATTSLVHFKEAAREVLHRLHFTSHVPLNIHLTLRFMCIYPPMPLNYPNLSAQPNRFPPTLPHNSSRDKSYDIASNSKVFSPSHLGFPNSSRGDRESLEYIGPIDVN